MSESIFAASLRAASRHAPVRHASTRPAPATLETRTTHASTNDALFISILDAPLLPGETARAGFLRKEAELRAAFAPLSVAAQRALHARLGDPRAGDPLAEHFARLTLDRRTRLLTFLADARRREAQAIANHR